MRGVEEIEKDLEKARRVAIDPRILTAAKLTNYRIGQLEKKVDKHNTVIERTFKLEEAQAVIQEQIKVVNHRISDLENKEE